MQNTGATVSTAITQGDTEMLRLVNIYRHGVGRYERICGHFTLFLAFTQRRA